MEKSYSRILTKTVHGKCLLISAKKRDMKAPREEDRNYPKVALHEAVKIFDLYEA